MEHLPTPLSADLPGVLVGAREPSAGFDRSLLLQSPAPCNIHNIYMQNKILIHVYLHVCVCACCPEKATIIITNQNI